MESNAVATTDALEIPNLSMAKDISDLISSVPDILSPEERVRIERFTAKIVALGKRRMSAMEHRSAEAELIYEIQQDEDWKLLVDPSSGDRYRNWYDFRVILATMMGLSTGTLGYYLKISRYAREVLDVPEGKLHEVNGLVTVKHMLDVTTGHDGRSTDDLSVMVRPLTKAFEKTLTSNYSELGDPKERGWKPFLKAYYYIEVAHTHDDPSAINLTPGELAAKARQAIGAPEFFARLIVEDDKLKYRIEVKHPDLEQPDGSTIVAETDTFTLSFEDNIVTAMVRDWVSKKLGVKER